jgi:hypothetical protein
MTKEPQAPAPPDWASGGWWNIEFICAGDRVRRHKRTTLGVVSRLCEGEFAGLCFPEHGTVARPRTRGLLYVWPDGAMTPTAHLDPLEWASYRDDRTWSFKCFRCTGRRGGERTLVLKDPQVEVLMARLFDARERVFDVGAGGW